MPVVEIKRLAVLVLCLGLAACGGGGGGGGGGSNTGAPADPGGGNPPAEDPAPSNDPPSLGSFTSFESGQVRPLALSADAQRLYAVNTPDARVEIFDLASGLPLPLASIRVGLEPVALALRNDNELWVVNHLSDSVSVIDLSLSPPRVVDTLYTGDEPRDIVFASGRAFVTAAHRGQNVPFDPQSHDPGIPRADVWVFDTDDRGEIPGGEALSVLSLFGDTPRALAVSGDGRRVYAAVFNSGNRSTTLSADIARGGLDKSGPANDRVGNPAPRTGLIVQWDGQHWLDGGDPDNAQAPRDWSERVRFRLPDYDLFEIDATANPPREIGRVSGVGTTIFNMAVNPVSDSLYISNTEARNLVRFEGPGTDSTTVRGHFVEARVSVVDADQVKVRHLNKHISSYDDELGTESERALSLATPLGMVVSADGETLYLAAFGSQRIARYPTAALAEDSFEVNAQAQLALTAGGPSGLVLDESRKQLYVLSRFDNGISTVDLDRWQEIDHLRMFNPEPARVLEGRPLLYDARLTSSRGDSSCAGCHIFGDTDHLAWDLGNPDEVRVDSPNTYNSNVPSNQTVPFFHPLKGPMGTQSLRGLRGHGPMHWRGDRTGSTRDSDESLEEQAFEDFNVAFTGLLGRAEELSAGQMDAFAGFALEMTYPPNPHRALDNSLDIDEAAGRDFYFDVISDTIATCNGCHLLDEEAGFFGTDGTMSIEGGSIDEDFKIPHLRNAYQKVGMFGSTGNPANSAPQRGDQVRGFGFAHDGAVDTLSSFLSAAVFAFPDERTRRQTADFVLAFPSELAPIVGQQITVRADNSARNDVQERVDLLLRRSLVTLPRPECELVVAGVLGEREFSAVMNSDLVFVTATSGAETPTLQELLGELGTAEDALTFSCMPPGNGSRFAVDRDADGVLDNAPG